MSGPGSPGRVLAAVAVWALAAQPVAVQIRPGLEPPWQAFITAIGLDRRASDQALADIAARWQNGYTAMIIDVTRILHLTTPGPASPSPGDFPPDRLGLPDIGVDAAPSRGSGFPTDQAARHEEDVRRRLTAFLEKQTGQRFGNDLRAWRKWMWSLPASPHSQYATFKAEVYGRIDPRFRRFFLNVGAPRIRLDEIDWGGVTVNGIPPLRMPKHVPAAEATWLRDGHVVFGIIVNGEARAYPKRILAWHEMAIDRVGGVDLTIVYCTLCGTVVPYESRVGGQSLTFGTSGLLYRSNKLMFDEQTSSLWSAVEGVPVVGPLASTNLRLNYRSVVTTTWRDWKRSHPTTTVLSIHTGYKRDYGEGAAYRDYFATDQLMFDVPTDDRRLKNKAEVLVLRRGALGPTSVPVAIAVDRLRQEPVLHLEESGRALVVLTTPGGANRVFERGSHAFVADKTVDLSREVQDRSGQRWSVTPEALVSTSGERLAAVAAHRAFWFGWIAQYPDTKLVR